MRRTSPSLRGVVTVAVLLGAAGCGPPEPLLPAGTTTETGTAARDVALHVAPIDTAAAGGGWYRATYRAAPELREEEVLRLRARYRTRSDDIRAERVRQGEVALLRRVDPLTFQGTFRMPDSVVYARHAVEDTTGSLIDTNDGLFWEQLRRDAEGEPTYEALFQSTQEHVRSDASRMGAAAVELASRFPDRPGTWAVVAMAESLVLTSSESDRARRASARRARHFDRTLRRRSDLALDELAGMLLLAFVSRDEAMEARWRDLLLERHPGSGLAAHATLREISPRDEPAAYAAALERQWARTDSSDAVSASWGYRAHDHIVERGLGRAGTGDDADALLRWAERYLRVAPGARPRADVAASFLRHPELRPRGTRMLERELDRWLEGSEERRPLGRTRAEHRREELRQSARLLTRLGETRLLEGDADGALQALETASTRVWYPYVQRSLGHARLASGDTVAALRAWARVEAFRMGPPFRDSVRAAIGGAFVEDEWQERVAEAEREVYRDMVSDARARPVADDLPLTTDSGRRVRLGELTGRGPTVVVFWSTGCAPSLRVMPQIGFLSEWIAERGGRLLAVTRDARSDAFRRAVAEHEIEAPIYHDDERLLTRALANSATPRFYILDGSGHLRAEDGFPEVAQLWVRALGAEAAGEL